jgi:hypothetical protein
MRVVTIMIEVGAAALVQLCTLSSRGPKGDALLVLHQNSPSSRAASFDAISKSMIQCL